MLKEASIEHATAPRQAAKGTTWLMMSKGQESRSLSQCGFGKE